MFKIPLNIQQETVAMKAKRSEISNVQLVLPLAPF